MELVFKIGQTVKCKLDGVVYDGTIKKVEKDHIIVDVPEVSDHCRFEEDCNMYQVFPKF